MTKFVIGIDEAGRGPLAGPLAVGACLMSENLNRTAARDFFPGGKIKDSKKLSPEKRQKIFGAMNKAREQGQMAFSVAFTSSVVIDREGLTRAAGLAIKTCLSKIEADPSKCFVMLDGGLKAPVEFKNQKTIVKGDGKEALIALASIAAKVSRDKKMLSLHKKYPEYGFERHKGYGTKLHYAKLKEHGLSVIHRRSFLKDFVK